MSALPWPTRLETPRLTLRPFTEEDTPVVMAIQSNWNVARNLRMADYPPTWEALSAWLTGHADEWAAGTAYRFALEWEGRVIGCCDIDEIEGDTGELGYWLTQPAWGKGLATEAARTVVDLAWTRLGLTGLNSGHAEDNPNSGRILRKLGFRLTGARRVWSKPREDWIVQRVYHVARSAWRTAGG